MNIADDYMMKKGSYMPSKKYLMKSVEDTYAFGKHLGEILKPNDIVALQGTLGAGKTTLTHGIAEGLGIQTAVSSPTFTLLFEHTDSLKNIPMYHFDAYRLHDIFEWYDAGFPEYFDADGVCIIEWANRIQEVLPERSIWLKITLDEQDENKRIYTLEVPFLEFDFQHLQEWEIDV